MTLWTKTLGGGLALALGTIAAPAMATDFTFSFTGSDNTSGTTLYRDFTATKGSETLKVRVTGWYVTSSGKLEDSYVGRYGGGVGVTNDDESGSGSTHTIDNQSGKDFVLLQFSAPVLLTEITKQTFSIGGYDDSDYTLGYGTVANAWNTTIKYNNQGLDGQSSSVLNAMLKTTELDADKTKNLKVGVASNLWLVAASFANVDKELDAFKLTGVNVSTTAVPEPATWAMMILGFGMVGMTIRRRRTTEATATVA